jgi:hypothetical protein
MTTFADLSATQAANHITVTEGMTANRRYYDGDHWQQGAGWIGPMPTETSAEAVQIIAQIQRGFVSKNAIRETVLRHLAGVIGHEPRWSLSLRRALADGEEPTAEEQELIQEAEALLREWWDWRGIHQIISRAVVNLLLSGRAPLRLFVPDANRDDETGDVPTIPLPDAVWYVWCEALSPAQATVFTDASTMADAGVYQYTPVDLAGVQQSQVTELTYLDDGGQTVLRVLQGSTEADTRLPLDGGLLLYEMEAEALIGEQVRQQQKLLNLARTMLARNVVVGGFLERVFLNAQMPGSWSRDDSTGQETFTAEQPVIGPGTTNYAVGVPVFDDAGNVTGYTTPSVVYRDPVPVTTFEETSRSAYRGILEETRQVHALLSGDAAPSGESRRQALFDFVLSLMDTASEVEEALRWLLETTLNFAATFAGEPARFTGLRASVTCRIDAGPISEADMSALVDVVGARLMSRRTAMARLGVDDPDAEEQQIEQEQEQEQEQARMSLGEAMLRFDRNGGITDGG